VWGEVEGEDDDVASSLEERKVLTEKEKNDRQEKTLEKTCLDEQGKLKKAWTLRNFYLLTEYARMRKSDVCVCVCVCATSESLEWKMKICWVIISVGAGHNTKYKTM
jgi:hypothetical protein